MFFVLSYLLLSSQFHVLEFLFGQRDETEARGQFQTTLLYERLICKPITPLSYSDVRSSLTKIFSGGQTQNFLAPAELQSTFSCSDHVSKIVKAYKFMICNNNKSL